MRRGQQKSPGMVLFNIGLPLLPAAYGLMDALCPCPCPCPCPCLPSIAIAPVAVVFRLSLADAAVEFAFSVAI